MMPLVFGQIISQDSNFTRENDVLYISFSHNERKTAEYTVICYNIDVLSQLIAHFWSRLESDNTPYLDCTLWAAAVPSAC